LVTDISKSAPKCSPAQVKIQDAFKRPREKSVKGLEFPGATSKHDPATAVLESSFMDNSEFSSADLASSNIAERVELARKLGRFLSLEQPEAERTTAEKLAAVVATDSELKVRKILVEELRTCPFIPSEVAKKIADDVEEVAEPFLLDTEQLAVETLEEIAYQCGDGARQILARRAHLPEPVSFMITEVGEEKAVSNLMVNPTAVLSERVYLKANERFAESDEIMERMTKRTDLPLSVIDVLIHRIADRWRDHLIQTYELAPDFASYIWGQTRAKALIEAINKAKGPERLAYLKRVHGEGGLEGDLILQMLQQDELECFKLAMAVRARVPLENIEILLEDHSDLAFERLLEKAGIESALAPVFASTFKEKAGITEDQNGA
jgi:uncharacterized protein (DUF2336 family)